MKVTKRIIMIILFIIAMFSIFALCLREGKGLEKVKEITEETYKELQETDEMYGHLP